MQFDFAAMVTNQVLPVPVTDAEISALVQWTVQGESDVSVSIVALGSAAEMNAKMDLIDQERRELLDLFEQQESESGDVYGQSAESSSRSH